MSKNAEATTLNLRLGDLGATAVSLTEQANAETKSQFFRSLIRHLSEITNGQPFDVRDLTLKGKDAQ